MKQRKRIVVGALLVVFCMAMTGCSQKVTVRSLFENANKNSKKMESVDLDILMDMECAIGAQGTSATMGMDFEINAKAENEKGAYMEGEGTVELMGSQISVPVKSYVEMGKDENKVYTYEPTSGQWIYDTTEAADMNLNLAAEDYSKIYKKLTLEEETTTYNEKECYKIAGQIQGSDISGLIEKLETEFSDTGVDAKAMEELKLNAEFYFDKESKNLAGATFDFSDSDWDQMLKEASSDLEDSLGAGTTMTMSKFTIEVRMQENSDYQFELPSEVTKEAVRSDEAA